MNEDQKSHGTRGTKKSQSELSTLIGDLKPGKEVKRSRRLLSRVTLRESISFWRGLKFPIVTLPKDSL